MQIQGTTGIDQTWLWQLALSFNKTYMQDLAVFLNQEAQTSQQNYSTAHLHAF